MLLLERANSFCVKHMQCYSKYTSNMYSYLTIDIGPIYLEIDYRKLLMFGQLCRLKCSFLANNVIDNRRLRFMNFDKQSRGFIPDTYRLLQKYGLVQCLDLYLTTGQFAWKTTLNIICSTHGDQRLWTVWQLGSHRYRLRT